MRTVAAILGALTVILVLWDTFQTIVLPRTVEGGYRLTTLFYRVSWSVWSALVRRMPARPRETLLTVFGPMSLLLLIGIWAALLILGFGLFNWGLQTPYNGATEASLGSSLYFSGVTFFTLGFGDITPSTSLGRFMSVFEVGVGFGFLAVVISYLPILYQSFSRREIAISLLDARAGSPPTAAELLRRLGNDDHMESLEILLLDWEKSAAELLESYLSYPVLSYYRSQHERQSWLSAVTAILDTCAVVSLGFTHKDKHQGVIIRQSRLTFAMARHACVDLALIFDIPPKPPANNRLTSDAFQGLKEKLAEANIHFVDPDTAEQRLAKVRVQYEPYVASLAEVLFMELPPWFVENPRLDNWQVSAWDTDKHF